MRALFLLVACTTLACTTTARLGETDNSQPETDTETCALEGEACILYGEFESNCCLSRQTCFPEGCYYSQPSGQ